MAKAKLQKGAPGTAQSHLRARISYLHKASAYILAASSPTIPPHSNQETPPGGKPSQPQDIPNAEPTASSSVRSNSPGITDPYRAQTPRLPRQYLSQMRGTSLKSQLRLPQDVKRSVCKRCDILQIPGSNCTEEIENLSRGKKKPWADVRVVRCTACGTTKRFPQASTRSSKLSERSRKKLENPVQASTRST